jgi:membrane-associated phospholipid phosphatase
LVVDVADMRGQSQSVKSSNVPTSPKNKREGGRGGKIANASALAAISALAAWAAFGDDSKLSSYATEHTPIFGSKAKAQQATDVLQSISVITAALIYAIAYTPPINTRTDFPYIQITNTDNTMNGYSADGAFGAAAAFAASCAVTSTATEILKKYAARPRPDASENLSFPSGHATAAAWANRYSARMIKSGDLPPQYAYPAYGALALLTLGTAWGRVEGARHYPSDVLAGIFIGVSLTDASFAAFEDGGGASGTKFDILLTNERGAATATLLMTVDF